MINQASFPAAGANRGASDAVWGKGVPAHVTQAIATIFGTPASRIVGVGALFDLRRCFDPIPGDILVRRALAARFPSPALRMALAAFPLPRVFSVCNWCSQPLNPTRGIVAGGAFAIAPVVAFTAEPFDSFRQRSHRA